ncbi:MAG TPA: glycosyltransferase [Myxococcota bacterium]|nr:glycosyltransferase [Myxococcota bacterium]HRY93142.1 glycosyltransferase [Myxococcota bacterium]
MQRNLKFAKYLPDFGWLPHVLTVKDVTYHSHDETLIDELPPQVKVYRSESLDPWRLSARAFPGLMSQKGASGETKRFRATSAIGIYKKIRDYLLFPDAQVGWIPFAYRMGLNIIEKEKFDAIFARATPISCGIVAYCLSQKTKLPYILDFADLWTDDPYTTVPTSLQRRGHEFLEKKIVGCSNAVTVATGGIRSGFANRYPWLGDRIELLYNGFDEMDFAGRVPSALSRNGRQIVYMGSLYDHHIENLRYFLSAMQMLPKKILETLSVRIIGNVVPSANAIVEEYGLKSNVHFSGYLSHSEAIDHLTSSDAALLFVRPGDIGMVTGKVFEYLASGIPIIACAEPIGECATVLKMAGRDSFLCRPNDPAAILHTLLELEELGWPRANLHGTHQFSRKNTTGRLAALLSRIA